MSEYVIPLVALLLTFLSTLSCLRFVFSRQGFFWIIPFVLSVLLTFNNFFILLYSQMSFFSYPKLVVDSPVVITFHYALKRGVLRNRVSNDQKKNYQEALFLEKIERREFIKFSKRKKEILENGAYEPKLYRNDECNLTLFDNPSSKNFR